MQRTRHHKPLMLPDAERRTLEEWARRPKQLSADPQFVEKVRDIVGLYLHPPDRALVLSVDEKTQVQALERTRPLLPLRPGLPARRTPNYIRHGTTSLFAALNVATGKVIGQCHRRHRHQEPGGESRTAPSTSTSRLRAPTRRGSCRSAFRLKGVQATCSIAGLAEPAKTCELRRAEIAVGRRIAAGVKPRHTAV